MPQLIMGAGNPVAVSIEAGILVYLGTMNNLPVIGGLDPLMRAAALGGAYYAYNMFVVPQFQ